MPERPSSISLADFALTSNISVFPKMPTASTHFVDLLVRGEIACLSTLSDPQASAALAEELLPSGTTSSEQALGIHRLRDGWLYPMVAGQAELWFLPTGELEAIESRLEGQNFIFERVVLSRYPDRSCFEETLLGMPRLRIDERLFLDALTSQPCGQILVAKQNEVVDRIALMVYIFADSDMLVVAKNKQEAERLRQRLSQMVEREITMGGELPCLSGDPNRWPVLHVATLKTYQGMTAGRFDVVILADLESARSKIAITNAWASTGALFYALVPQDRRLDEEDQLRIALASGPVIYRPVPESLTQVTVLPIGPSTYPGIPAQDGLERKRLNFWCNDRRNDHIATVSLAFLQRDRRELQRQGLLVGPVIEILEAQERGLGIAILVESVEQGQALRKCLPRWPLLHAKAGIKDDPEMETPIIVEKCAIITRNRARRAGVAADVLIRADASADTWGEDLGPIAFIHDTHVILVDHVDDTDERAARDGQRRWAAYRQRGWLASDGETAEPESGHRAGNPGNATRDVDPAIKGKGGDD